MFNALNKYYNRQSFHPDFLSIFINPFYIIRKGMIRLLRRKAILLKGKMIDFGCGLKPYRELFTYVDEYVGVDIENEAHSHEKEKIDVFYDGKSIPFPDAYFDSLFSSEVFEHVFNLEEILSELNRVLKKDSLVLITVPFVWDEHEIPFDFGRYSSYGIRHLLEKAGFEVMAVEKNGNAVAVLHQLLIVYFRNLLFGGNKYLNMMINFLFLSPLTILGIISSAVLPKNKKLYFNNVVLAIKK